MKRRLKGSMVIATSAIAVMVFFGGCSSKNTATNKADVSGQEKDSKSTATQQGNVGKVDLIGEVTKVNGSEITVKVIEMPQFPGDFRNGDGQQGQRPNRERNQGENQGDQNGQNSQTDEQRKQRGDGQQGQPRGNMERKYTGENKTIKIPDDIKVTTNKRGDDGKREQVNVAVSEIKEGNIITVWYSDKEKGTISRINLNTFTGRGAQQESNSAKSN